MNKNRRKYKYKNISCEKKVSYITEVLLVHLDLFDIRGVVGCVDLVLVLVVGLTIQALRKRTGNI